MKNLLTIALTLITTQTFACPSIEGSYNKCELVSVTESSDLQIQYDIYDDLKISGEGDLYEGSGLKILRINETYSSNDTSSEINPFEVVVVGETRTIKVDDEMGSSVLTMSSSCNETSLSINYSYEGVENYEEGTAVINGKMTDTFSLTEKGIRVTSQSVDTEGSSTLVVECQKVLAEESDIQ
jgi:hypothetical protein